MFKHKIGETYYSLDDLSGWNGWSTNDGKLTFYNKLYVDMTAVELAAPLEDWRSVTLPGYQIYSTTTKSYSPIKVLQAESLPKPNELRITLVGGTITIYPNTDKTKLTINWDNGAWTEERAIPSKEDSSKSIIPSWILFELQGDGGGGGGSGSTISGSENGAGGGGGGYITGLLKLNFSVYSKYEIQIGSGGAGGAEKSSGSSGSGSYLYGVNSSGAKTLLAAAYGGEGGISNNNKWSGKSPAAGGSAYVADKNYIKNATIIAGGNGGQTNDKGTCSGAAVNTGSKTVYYLDSSFPQYYTNSYFYKTLLEQVGGAAGTSNHSGGGGAAALGPGGAGGGNQSDGNTPDSGYGGGGGGGRWTLGSPKKGGKGKNGCFKLYY